MQQVQNEDMPNKARTPGQDHLIRHYAQQPGLQIPVIYDPDKGGFSMVTAGCVIGRKLVTTDLIFHFK
jgi:hypothetical protein